MTGSAAAVVHREVRGQICGNIPDAAGKLPLEIDAGNEPVFLWYASVTNCIGQCCQPKASFNVPPRLIKNYYILRLLILKIKKIKKGKITKKNNLFKKKFNIPSELHFNKDCHG